jgi:hypothetical protein
MTLKEIERWYDSYRREFGLISKEIEDWYEAYRRDCLPKHVRHSGSAVESVVEKPREVLFRDLVLVGRGRITNSKCGNFMGFYGCVQHQKHESDVAYVLKYFNSCDRPTCPKCYRYGWAVKESRALELRLLAASEKFGLSVEHVICSLPECDYDLTFKEAKRKCREILFSRGVEGGVMIAHGNRIDRCTGVESYSPHWHILGFVKGGYEGCRNCERKWNCREGCGGFDDRNHQLSLKDGYVVKVLGKRKTIGGTCWYQLHHSSTNPFKKRFRIATYFGSCGYNNLGAKVEKRKSVCPLCDSPMGFIEYLGSKDFVVDKNSRGFVAKSSEDYFENGVPVWRVKEVDKFD